MANNRDQQARERLRLQREHERLVNQQRREAERARQQAEREQRSRAEAQRRVVEATAESERRLAELRASRERLVVAADAERRRLERNLHDGAQQRLVVLRLQLAEIRADLPVLVEHFGLDRPDVVCFDAISPFGSMIAEKLGARGIALSTNLVGGGTFMPERFDFGHPRLVAVRSEMAAFAAEHGVSLPDPMAGSPAGTTIVFAPRAFQPGGDEFDEGVRLVGPSLDRHEEPFTPPGSPLLYISLGTAHTRRPEFFRTCVASFADTPWRVVLATGAVDAGELGAVPENFTVAPSFPQIGVLRAADVFVTHAGLGSVLEALALGVPTAAVPQFPEQETNAARVRDLGLGRWLDAAELDPGSLRAAVEDVAEDADVRANLAWMRQVIAESGGAAAAADIVESRL